MYDITIIYEILKNKLKFGLVPNSKDFDFLIYTIEKFYLSMEFYRYVYYDSIEHPTFKIVRNGENTMENYPQGVFIEKGTLSDLLNLSLCVKLF